MTISPQSLHNWLNTAADIQSVEIGQQKRAQALTTTGINKFLDLNCVENCLDAVPNFVKTVAKKIVEFVQLLFVALETALLATLGTIFFFIASLVNSMKDNTGMKAPMNDHISMIKTHAKQVAECAKNLIFS